MKNEFFKDARLLEALDYIDDDLIGEVADKLRVPKTSPGSGENPKKRNPFGAWRQIAALVACALIMSAMIPTFSMLFDRIVEYVTDSDAAHSNGTDIGEEEVTKAAQYCTVTIKGEAEHLLYSGEIKMRAENGASFTLDGKHIASEVLREGYEIVSAEVRMSGETLEGVYNAEKNAFLIEKVTGDVEIELTTRKIKLTIVLFIDGTEVDRQVIEYGDEYRYVHKYDDGLSVSSFGGGSSGMNHPIHDLDQVNHTLTFKIPFVKDNSIMKYHIDFANKK